MGQRLVICIDGTSNQPVGNRTNVIRLYRMLEQLPGQQVAYYQPGVGTLQPRSASNWIRQQALIALDKMTAIMLYRHISSVYRYLMAQYQEGTELYLFGFSRGAYTARVLAGMLTRVGLLHPGHDEMIQFAWDVYRRTRDQEDHVQAARFRKTFSRAVKVRFLGLWDTVSSVGLPWRPRSYPYTFDNSQVQSVRHALALDERRVMFVQNQWTAHPRPSQDVQQVWFAGAHADVGGGYADTESQLAMIPLAWMLREARAAGLTFKEHEVANLLTPEGKGGKLPAPDVSQLTAQFAAANAHDELERRPFWKLLEQLPIPRQLRDAQGQYQRYWIRNQGRYRRLPEDALIHQSVRLRQEKITGYLQGRLPPGYRWVE